ncbi:MAG: hypothetical protein AAGG11_05230 [Pseudomonadota bacterium]
MGTFFNEAVAAGLQYVTFPLELTGLALALIEVRFPKLAAYLTQQIEQLSAPMRDLRSDRSSSESTMERSLGLLLSRMLKAGYLILTAIYAAKLIHQLLDRGPEPSGLIGLLIGYVVAGVVMTIALLVLGLTLYFLVVGGSDFARRFVAGRAIGTLGILIAGIGLLGELYQLLTQIIR